MTRLAVGLVHHPPGTPLIDRHWARALVVQHAHDQQLRLLDVLEIGEGHLTCEILRDLADLAAIARIAMLVTEGVDEILAESIARELGLTHEPVPSRARPHQVG